MRRKVSLIRILFTSFVCVFALIACKHTNEGGTDTPKVINISLTINGAEADIKSSLTNEGLSFVLDEKNPAENGFAKVLITSSEGKIKKVEKEGSLGFGWQTEKITDNVYEVMAIAVSNYDNTITFKVETEKSHYDVKVNLKDGNTPITSESVGIYGMSGPGFQVFDVYEADPGELPLQVFGKVAQVTFEAPTFAEEYGVLVKGKNGEWILKKAEYDAINAIYYHQLLPLGIIKDGQVEASFDFIITQAKKASKKAFVKVGKLTDYAIMTLFFDQEGYGIESVNTNLWLDQSTINALLSEEGHTFETTSDALKEAYLLQLWHRSYDEIENASLKKFVKTASETDYTLKGETNVTEELKTKQAVNLEKFSENDTRFESGKSYKYILSFKVKDVSDEVKATFICQVK